ncbi:hypothetical protein Cme02nite_52500 [Catellatospora methionotrophica]|uniref:DivIVA domain-containing protein n=1 Tax=Catellatospora methionotrophica TaxID=121620 RepID=A0A8J3LEN0_9ACTN|nr:DivIVA domain-containing protein [Catellatospora methionotrophica]GIG16918.1 hypothetical protein Cme02nite_52500 [Catellatospora methionotrophica]
MLPPPEFAVVRVLGYRRDRVDRLIEAVYRGEANLAGKRTFDLPVVMHGYDCAQVDAYLAQVAALHEAHGAFRPLADPDSGVPTVGPVASRPPAFRRAIPFTRGYDPAQVDALVARIAPVLAGGVGITSAEIEEADLPLVRRGYDVERVDAYLDAVVIRLRAEGR